MTALQGTVLITVLTALVTGSDDFRSDYKYHSVAHGWFKLHTVPAKWEDARLRCTLEGSVLASPINVDISDVMHSILRSHGQSSSFSVHTGVHSTMSPTEYMSLEGVPLTEMPVGTNDIFPEDFRTARNCLRFSRAGLVASSCEDYRSYLCYKKKTADLEITECGTVDKAYQLNNKTGHCYKFHKYPVYWPIAQVTCAAEGGYLAIINSAAESEVLKNLFAKYPDDSILGPYISLVHIGFYDWNKNRIWRTVHGETLEEAGYARWSGGKPNNQLYEGVGQYCGAMFRSGELDDIWCDYEYAFICEKDPASLRLVSNQCDTD